jgi:hypothetical protein
MTPFPINVTAHPQNLTPEEREFWGQQDLTEIDAPLSEDEAFDLINGRLYVATWPDDKIPW